MERRDRPNSRVFQRMKKYLEMAARTLCPLPALILISTATAWADCVCSDGCTQCLACPSEYDTPLYVCDRCYYQEASGAGLHCVFIGQRATPKIQSRWPDIPGSRWVFGHSSGDDFGRTLVDKMFGGWN